VTRKSPGRSKAEPGRGDPPRQGRLSVSEYVAGILKGDRTILAKAVTLVESSHGADRDLAAEILETCLTQSGDQIVVGVSGVPGAGKSSLIEALGKHIIKNHGEKIAVLAIDPSSRLSGGSILGDKTRMPYLASSEMAFVRPSPSRGSLGGVAAHTRDAIALCKAAGFRNVFIETVGVGQSETAVREMVDFFLLVTLSGAGDELQGMKRGVMEIADAVAVNKADGDNVRPAEKARSDAEGALHLFPSRASGWSPRALACSARTGVGVREIWSLILEHHQSVSENGYLERVRRDQNLGWLRESVERGLMQMLSSNPIVRERLAELEQQVADGMTSPVAAAKQVLSLYSDQLHRSNED
jgi:LAO/AO transport system kinase